MVIPVAPEGLVVIGALQPMVMTKGWAAVVALLLLVIPTAVLHLRLAAHPQAATDAAMSRRRGLAGLIIGKDGRASTSRFGVVLWTFAVFYAMSFMLIFGRSANCGDHNYRSSRRCTAAHHVRAEITNNFGNRDLQPAYLILLGFPVGAALTAQAITGSRARANKGYKKPITEDKRGLLQAARELTGDDDGATDLLDSQYLAFNVLTIGFFLLEFVAHPLSGLPDLPPTLLALSGVAASAYTTNKALDEPDHQNGDGLPAPEVSGDPAATNPTKATAATKNPGAKKVPSTKAVGS